MARKTLDLIVAAFEAAPSEFAVLHRDGTILAVNAAWRRFGELNGAGSRCGVGTNYLHVTDQAARDGDDVAATACAALEAVFNGDAEKMSMDYPCHSPRARQWFRVRVSTLNELNALLMTHDNVTDRIQQISLQPPHLPPPARPALAGVWTDPTAITTPAH